MAIFSQMNISEMTGKELEKIWIWLKKEYGGK